MTNISQETIDARHNILKACVARMDEMGLKGKARERAALDYLCGAAMALHEVKHELSGNLILLLQMVFCVRGAYSEAKHMVIRHEQEINIGKAAE